MARDYFHLSGACNYLAGEGAATNHKNIRIARVTAEFRTSTSQIRTR
jgi:hypothetical protein